MKGPGLIFRLDMHRQFLSVPCLPSTRSCGHIASASDCADRPMAGRDFASPATSSVNHSRGDLTREASGIQSKENGWKTKMNATVFRNRSLSLRKLSPAIRPLLPPIARHRVLGNKETTAMTTASAAPTGEITLPTQFTRLRTVPSGWAAV